MRTASLAIIAACALAASPSLAAPAETAGSDAVPAESLRGVPVAFASLRERARRPTKPTTVKAALRDGYKPLSEITGGAYGAFTPGIGAVYVRKENLPNGPFLAFDRKGRQVSTIYKFSLEGLNGGQSYDGSGRMPAVDHFTVYKGGSHPGVDFPNLGIVFWHVPKKDKSRVAE